MGAAVLDVVIKEGSTELVTFEKSLERMRKQTLQMFGEMCSK